MDSDTFGSHADWVKTQLRFIIAALHKAQHNSNSTLPAEPVDSTQVRVQFIWIKRENCTFFVTSGYLWQNETEKTNDYRLQLQRKMRLGFLLIICRRMMLILGTDTYSLYYQFCALCSPSSPLLFCSETKPVPAISSMKVTSLLIFNLLLLYTTVTCTYVYPNE